MGKGRVRRWTSGSVTTGVCISVEEYQIGFPGCPTTLGGRQFISS